MSEGLHRPGGTGGSPVAAGRWPVATGLTIERLACRYFLPSGLPDPAAARARLTRLAEQELPGACAAALESFPADDEAVYRIRRLHLELWLDLIGMPERDMAQRWGRLLALAVARAVQRGAAQHVVRFDSPRQFVAAFLRDLLDGRAWDRWYYSEFRPLRRLATGAVAAELLAPRPDWIAPLLAELAASGHAERMIEQWRAPEIARLWAALGFAARLQSLPLGPETMRRVSLLASLWSGLALSTSADPAARARDRLRVWLMLATVHPQASRDPALASIAHAMVDLAGLVHIEPDLGPTLMMESGLYPALARRIAGGPLADVLSWLAPGIATPQGRSLVARLAEVVAAPRPPSTADADVAPPSLGRLTSSALSSPVGSVFLAMPALVELGVWERWRDAWGEETSRNYLFVLALKLLGRDRAPLLLGDRMLAAFAGLHQPPVADVRASAFASPHTSSHSPHLGDLADIAASWYPPRDRDLVLGAAHGVEVLRDAAAACWLAACPADSSSASTARLVCRPDLAAETAAARQAQDERDRQVLSDEVRHFQLGRRLGYRWLTPQLDASLSVAASLVLRRTAARLPGFARASPAYLARQFLAQPASLRPRPDALEVPLSGGPLAVVLHLAALPEQLDVPWLAQPLRLRLPGLLVGTN